MKPEVLPNIIGTCPGPPEPATFWPTLDVSVARQRLVEEMERLLDRETEFRAVAAFLSYVSPDGELHIAHGSGVKTVYGDVGRDFVELVKALRQAADEIEEILAGKPVPDGVRVEGIGSKEKP